ncbi:MAG: hypothetical protein ACRDUW_23290 [Pseudonocardiaceae bacterium]
MKVLRAFLKPWPGLLIIVGICGSAGVLIGGGLQSCQSLGLAPAQSFDSKLAYAYGIHTAVLQTAGSAVQAGSLKASDGTAVLNLADQARTLLDSARVIKASDPTGAGSKLVLATEILTQLQSYLQSRGIK